ncbi:MAG: hypothetical protein EON60_02655 [Alphaproteobacteria bacterium]|nr:MAG: hypothetical protein EON60_02655 [Alphaproteobacteria bacterium]
MGVIKATVLSHPGAQRWSTHAHTTFGCILTVLLALLSLLLTWWSGEANPIPLMLGAWTFLLALWSPAIFYWPHRIWDSTWLAFGHLIILIMWVFYILPSGVLMQARGRDPLDLRFLPEARTYWKRPTPTGTMQNARK